MFSIPRQSYTEEFKREAVKMLEAGQRPAVMARHLGVAEHALNKLLLEAAAGKLAGTNKIVTAAQMELSRLRAENQRLKMENEILKKPLHTLRRNSREARFGLVATRALSTGCVMYNLMRISASGLFSWLRGGKSRKRLTQQTGSIVAMLGMQKTGAS